MTPKNKTSYIQPAIQIITFSSQPLMLQGSAGGPNHEVEFGTQGRDNTINNSAWTHTWE